MFTPSLNLTKKFILSIAACISASVASETSAFAVGLLSEGGLQRSKLTSGHSTLDTKEFIGVEGKALLEGDLFSLGLVSIYGAAGAQYSAAKFSGQLADNSASVTDWNGVAALGEVGVHVAAVPGLLALQAGLEYGHGISGQWHEKNTLNVTVSDTTTDFKDWYNYGLRGRAMLSVFPFVKVGLEGGLVFADLQLDRPSDNAIKMSGYTLGGILFVGF